MRMIGLIAGTVAFVVGIIGLALTAVIGFVISVPSESMPAPDRFPAPVSTVMGLLVMVNIFGGATGHFPVSRVIFFAVLAAGGWFVQSWARQSTTAEA